MAGALYSCGQPARTTDNLAFTFKTGQAKLICQGANPQDGSGGYMLAPSILKQACQALQTSSLPSSSSVCKGQQSGINWVKISGLYQGRKINIRLQQGPCIESLQTWEQWAVVWSAQAARHYKMQKIFIAPISQQLPSKIPTDGAAVYTDCSTSLSAKPLAACSRQVSESEPDALLLPLNNAQLEYLFGAKAEQINKFLSQAAFQPVPAGYPGYQK